MATSKKEIEDKWDAKVLCSLEKDVLALMAIIKEHIDYENNWIIDSGCSNYMIGDQEKILQDSNNRRWGSKLHTFGQVKIQVTLMLARKKWLNQVNPVKKKQHLNNIDDHKEFESQIKSMSMQLL